MRLNRSLFHLLALPLLAVALSCDGTWTGNGIEPVGFDPVIDGGGVYGLYTRVTFRLVSDETDGGVPVARDSDGAPFRFDASAAYLKRIVLELPSDVTCGRFSEIMVAPLVTCDAGLVSINGPFRVNLRSGRITPSLADVPLPLTVFGSVLFELEPGDPADGLIDAGSPLNGKSLVASGPFGDPGDGTFFSLAVSDPMPVFLPGPVSLPHTGDFRLAMDVTDWFAGLPLTACVASEDLELSGDVLTIANGTGDCSDIESVLATAIEASGAVAE